VSSTISVSCNCHCISRKIETEKKTVVAVNIQGVPKVLTFLKVNGLLRRVRTFGTPYIRVRHEYVLYSSGPRGGKEENRKERKKERGSSSFPSTLFV
jgi:hypothetical protein